MRSKIVFLGLTALALTASPATAQKPFSFGVGGGVALPLGNFKDQANTGLNATVALGLGLPMLPVGVRIEGAYNRFGFSDEAKAVFLGEKGNWSISSATANVTLGLPISAVVVSPYLIAGGGMYWNSCSLSICTSESDFGYNVGLGVKLRALVASGYLEARYHSVQSEGESTNFIPITIGFTF